MMRYSRLIWVFFRLGVLHELQYRANFYIQVFQSTLQVGTALAGLAVVFAYTDTISGWRPAEVLAQVGVFILVGGAINLVIQPSMQQLIEDVHRGALDFTLVKPADAQVLVSVRQVQIWRLVDVALGLGVLAVAFGRLGVVAGARQAGVFILMLLAGGVIIYSFWLILATSAFWLVRANNILVIFQDMYQAGRWPVQIYPQWLRLALTFLVPVAFATTVPASALAGRLTFQTLLGALALAITLLIGSRWFWRVGLRHYSGASA
jgi:ABC-2 type transport system permease protein